MPRLRCRFTVRQLMILVAVVAVAQGLGTPAWRWHKVRRRLAAQQAFYAEGRITIDRLVGADRQLRDAELAFCWTNQGKTTTLAAHIDRAARMVADDRRIDEGFLHCRSAVTDADIAEAEIEEARGQLQALLEAESAHRGRAWRSRVSASP